MIYIAGKPNCDAAEMCAAEKAEEIILSMLGVSVTLGHMLGRDGASRQKYMLCAYEEIENADSVVFLPDWRKHEETRLQHGHCRYIGKKIMYFKITAAGAVLTLPRVKIRRVKNGKHR